MLKRKMDVIPDVIRVIILGILAIISYLGMAGYLF